MSRAWVAIKRLGRVIKFLSVCIIITVCVFLAWRIFSTGIPDSIKTILPNEKLCEAYAQKGEELVVFDQYYDNITTDDRNRGYFAVPEAIFIPEVNQAQLVFRYNNSTVRALAEDYGLDPAPDREQDLYDVTLVFYIDLTPDDLTDNEEISDKTMRKIRVKPFDSTSERTTLYSFYRYSFDFDDAEEPINMQELIDEGLLIAVHAEFYYNQDINYDQLPYGALNLYYFQRSNSPVKLTAADKKALTN